MYVETGSPATTKTLMNIGEVRSHRKMRTHIYKPEMARYMEGVDLQTVTVNHYFNLKGGHQMSAIFVINVDGERLMPTFNCKKVRKMLKDGRAVIYKYKPFTIQLTYKATNHTQDIEFCSDCGYQYEGISVKSEKHEYVSLQADMLDDEKNRHDDRRKYRRTRRNRKRYRAPRFNNRIKNKKAGWLAPSLKNRMDNQVRLYERLIEVCPITKATVEVGRFDTQVMEAIEKGEPPKVKIIKMVQDMDSIL